MRALAGEHEGASHRIRTCTETQKRNYAGQERHRCGSPILSESAHADFRRSTKAARPAGMNTIDCSPIGCNGLSSWLLQGNQVGGSETLIGDGHTDSQESARLEPGSVLRRVQPYLHEFAGARPEKPDDAQADRAVRGHGRASADAADAGLCRR